MHSNGPQSKTFRACQIAIAVVIVLAALPGCAAVKATQQPGKKNLGVLTPGTPRSHVIAELGPPMWTEERDGATVDIFAFKQGYSKGAKAGRALLHGAADVATWGLWEVVGIPAESLADGQDVKVEITYDAQRSVRSLDVIQGQDVIAPRPLFGRLRKSPPTAITAQREAASETE
ncbi:MAG TPA: hypothetical protein VHV08_14190 [Pirellulales bacterium]|nr:hypothetical protein [Pirellulales bacterium]